ncbi:MAG TPA: LPD38 domain-containing protein [Thermoanaerobaculia bacterium]|jgi:hypothetical protein
MITLPKFGTQKTTQPVRATGTIKLPAFRAAQPTTTPATSSAPLQTTPSVRYGSSVIKDPSGKPLLTANNPRAAQSQLLRDRVHPGFDFTKPQKLTRTVLTNGRIPVEVSQAIRKELGAAYDDQLDHQIALQLSGSNQRPNLALVPGRTTRGKVYELDQLGNALARRVIKGEISLLDAQRELAKAKGRTLTEDLPGSAPLTPSKPLPDVPARRTPAAPPFELPKLGKNGFSDPKTAAPEAGATFRKAGKAARDFGAGVLADPATAKEDPRFGTAKELTPYALGLSAGMLGPFDEAAKLPGATKRLASKAAPVAQEAFDAAKYVAENVAKRARARGIGPKLLDKAGSFLKNAKSKLVDFAAPIEDVLADTLKKTKISLKPSEHISGQIDRVLRAPTIAGQFVRDGGLETVIKDAPDLDALDQYLIARHARTVEANGVRTGRDLAKDAKLIETLAPAYEPHAQTVTEYSQRLLDYAVDSGLISKDLAAKLKETYPDYVPLNRIFDEAELPTHPFMGGKAVASLSKQSVVQRLSGSEREIASPIESLIAKTNDAFRQGEKNKAARLLAGYRDLPGNPFQLRELPPGESAPHTISFLDDGRKRTFATTKEIADAARALNVQQLNILGKILALPVRIAKLGITGINIPFVASNVAKDQVTAFINSNKALRTSIANPVNFVRALFAAVRHDDLYEELVRQGAGGTSFDIARDQIPATVQRIRAGRSIPSRVLYTVKHPGDLLRAVENIIGRSEEVTRLQQYRGTKEALVKEGMDPREAAIAGAKAARENTVNFARRGEWGTVLNSAFLYLNAGIQGTRTLVRSATTRPLQTGAKIATAVFMPVSIATAWNLSDPKRREAYEDIAEFEKENNIIIVPPNPTKDERGRWNVIKIPLAQGVNSLASVPRRAIEQAQGLDEIRFREIAQSLVATVSPIAPTKGAALSSLTPQAIKPTLEQASNTNFFTGRNIVPPYMLNKPPEDQTYTNTSGAARRIAKVFNMSPLKVESFIRETFGGVGTQALNAIDQALAAGKLIPREQIGGESTFEAVVRRFRKATGGEKERRQNRK